MSRICRVHGWKIEIQSTCEKNKLKQQWRAVEKQIERPREEKMCRRIKWPKEHLK